MNEFFASLSVFFPGEFKAWIPVIVAGIPLLLRIMKDYLDLRDRRSAYKSYLISKFDSKNEAAAKKLFKRWRTKMYRDMDKIIIGNELQQANIETLIQSHRFGANPSHYMDRVYIAFKDLANDELVDQVLDDVDEGIFYGVDVVSLDEKISEYTKELRLDIYDDITQDAGVSKLLEVTFDESLPFEVLLRGFEEFVIGCVDRKEQLEASIQNIKKIVKENGGLVDMRLHRKTKRGRYATSRK